MSEQYTAIQKMKAELYVQQGKDLEQLEKEGIDASIIELAKQLQAEQDAHKEDMGIDLDFESDLDSEYYAQQAEFQREDDLERDEQLSLDDQQREDDLRQEEFDRQDEQRREDLERALNDKQALDDRNFDFTDRFQDELKQRAKYPDRESSEKQQQAIRSLARKDKLDLPENMQSMNECRAWLNAHGQLGKIDDLDRKYKGLERAVEHQAATGNKEAQAIDNLFIEDRAIEAKPEQVASLVRDTRVASDSNEFYKSYNDIYGNNISPRDVTAILAVNQCRKESSHFRTLDPENKTFQVSSLDDVKRFEQWKYDNPRQYIDMSRQVQMQQELAPISRDTYNSIVGLKTLTPTTAAFELQKAEQKNQEAVQTKSNQVQQASSPMSERKSYTADLEALAKSATTDQTQDRTKALEALAQQAQQLTTQQQLEEKRKKEKEQGFTLVS